MLPQLLRLEPVGLESFSPVLDRNGQHVVRCLERQGCLVCAGMFRGIDEELAGRMKQQDCLIFR